MKEIIKEFQSLSLKSNMLKHHFNNITYYNNEFFNSFAEIDNIKMKIINQINQILPIHNQIRQKRGLINGLGNIIKSITGNLDQEDAERLDHNIEILKQNQNNIKISLDKQTTLLGKSIKSFKTITENITHNQKILGMKVNQIITILKDIKTQEASDFEEYRTHMILTQISMFFQNIYDLLEKIEVAITFAKLNTFHNAIVKSAELLEELKIIDKAIKTEKLPFEPIPENILKIENIIGIKSYVKNFEINFIIEIPLVKRDNYNIFQLFPLPTPNGEYHKMIIPNFNYLIINERNFGYSDESCKQVVDKEYLCTHIHSENMYKNLPCEVQLLRYQHNLSNCNQIAIKIEKLDIQNIDEGKWILVTNKDIVATQYCGTSQDQVLFNGTYLIELSSPCSLKIDNVLIKSYRNSKDLFQNIPLPDFNLNLTHKTVYSNVNPLKMNSVNLNKLDDIQKEINVQKYENSKLLNNSIYYHKTSFWTILLYILLVILILYYVYKYLGPKLKVKTNLNGNEQNIII